MLLHPLYEALEWLARSLGDGSGFQDRFYELIGIAFKSRTSHPSQDDVAIVDDDATGPPSGVQPLANLADPVAQRARRRIASCHVAGGWLRGVLALGWQVKGDPVLFASGVAIDAGEPE
jgi:hypothetical protein